MSIFKITMDMINSDTLETFRDILDPEEFKDFFQRASQELDRSHSLMQAHFAAQEWDALRSVAHRLKGSLGSVGCDVLFSKLEKLEMQLRNEPLQVPLPNQMQIISETAQKTLLQLEKLAL
jgi:HPt (histidine-containing phosphotransfer) domain-containing protein